MHTRDQYSWPVFVFSFSGRSTNKAFTLIELMVVIAIVSLLSSVVMTNLNSTRAKARDARRIAELTNFAQGLELFYSKYGVYPCGDSDNGIGGMIDSSHSFPFLNGGTKPSGPPSACSVAPITGLYNEGILNSDWYQPPGDPEKYSYLYETTGDRQNFVLYVYLEDPGNASKMAKDGGKCNNLYEVSMGPNMTAPVGAQYTGAVTCN